MSDMNEAQKKRAPRWVKIVLMLSLAVNFAIAGVIGGAALRGHAPHDRLQTTEGVAVLARTMPMKFQRELRAGLRGQRGELLADRQKMQQLRDRLATALRTEPFDISAVETVFMDHRALLNDITASGHNQIIVQIERMDARDRARYVRNLYGRSDPRDGPPARESRP